MCICNLVSLRSVQTAIGDGCRTVADVSGRTRACSGCGSCTPVVMAMLEGQQTAPVVRPMRALWPVALVTLLLATLPLARWAPACAHAGCPAAGTSCFAIPLRSRSPGLDWWPWP